MQTVTEGLIIRSRNIGENDTAVTVLTRDYGLISAFANGSKRVKSRAAGSAVSPLTYSQLTLYRGRDSYIIDDAKALEVFFGLRRFSLTSETTLRLLPLHSISASLPENSHRRTPRLTSC